MAANIPEINDKVRRYLTDWLGDVQVDSEGNFNLRHGSTHVFIRVDKYNDNNTTVRVFAITNREVPPSPELYKYVSMASHDCVFGKLTIQELEEGLLVVCSQTLLGESLDPMNLEAAVAIVAGLADDIDDKIQAKFGGKKCYQE